MVCNGIHRDHAVSELMGYTGIRGFTMLLKLRGKVWHASLVTIHNRHKRQSVLNRVTLVTIGSQRALKGQRSGKNKSIIQLKSSMGDHQNLSTACVDLLSLCHHKQGSTWPHAALIDKYPNSQRLALQPAPPLPGLRPSATYELSCQCR